VAERRPAAREVDKLLRRLVEANTALAQALKDCDPSLFSVETADGESLKRTLERTSDDVNFYYGQLVSRARSLPQPPCIQRADFSSLREAAATVQIAHRRFSNLLHDLTPSDLERRAEDPELGTYTLRQILEMATAHYALRTQQVSRLKEETAGASK
jgi:DinB superfamily